MISLILPMTVCSSEQVGTLSGSLWGGESGVVRGAVYSRRIEFAAGRTCARATLQSLGVSPAPILSGANREPLWPSGIVGSITHCAGYCGAAAAKSQDIFGIGIDAERNEPLPLGVLSEVALPEEIMSLGLLPYSHVNFDRILFSAKESIYKALYPLTHAWLDFDEAFVTFNLEESSFTVRFSATSIKPLLNPCFQMIGRYLARDGFILTSFIIVRNKL
jgi:4'-phosphopantetheinyl transferase EntD